MNREETAQLVQEFYEAFINERDFDKAVTYLGDRYVQHSTGAADDLDSLRQFVEYMRVEYPELRVNVRRVFVDGDHVILHGHLVPVPGERGSAHVDIFRVADGKIVEHWEVDQPIPEHVPHDNGVV